MKQIAIIATLLVLVSQTTTAGPITDTYTAGDTLTATTMDNIKSAVNGNATDIGANTGNITTDGINIGTNSSAITDHDNRITALESLSGATSYLSIPARGGFVAFDQDSAFAYCGPNTFSWAGVGSSIFTAMVNLPHNSTITGFTYYFWRGAATLETSAALYRQAIPAATRQQIGSFTSSVADSGHTSGAAPTIDVTRAVVDNQNFTYYIEADLPEVGTLCVDGALITYTAP